MARRFIVLKDDMKKVENNEYIVFGSEVKHIQVLRFNVGDVIQINDNICKIIEMKRDTILIEIIKKAPDFGVPSINVTLYQAVLKGDKMEFVIQKAVELGVKNIVPFISKNVVVKLDDSSKKKKKEKYKKIADEACKQCGRTDEVNILDFMSFEEVQKDIQKYDKCFFAYENSHGDLKEECKNLHDKNVKNVSCIIGPEGGFDICEVKKITQQTKVLNVSLSKRILRAETAALSLCSIIMYELDS